MIESGTLLQNRYFIEKQIGVGGMGAVYLATDQRFNSHVAIKETFYKDQELADAFEREARLLNSLHHPVLPHVSDYFKESNGYFLVMQFIGGEDLSEILKREGAFPVSDVARWTNSLLDALDYLHSQETPIIHRDIKPQNLKITPRGDIILLDFGLAKLNTEDNSGALSVFGYSRKYSPLEQIQGTGTDARSDIFALGATVFHLLTGTTPIDVLARAAEIVAGNPDPLPMANEINNEVPLKVGQILHTALALNAARRFVSAKAMQQALEYAYKGELPENAEEIPEENIALPTAVNQVISTAENENFPALASFAAETSVGLPQNNVNDKINPIETAFLNASNLLPSLEVLPEVKSSTESAAHSNFSIKQSRFRLAAMAALLVCCGLAVLYLITKANSSSESDQTPPVQTASELNSNTDQTKENSLSPVPESSAAPQSEITAQKEATTASIKSTVDKRESGEKQKTADEPPSQIEPVEKPKPAPVESQRQSAPQPSNQIPSRVEQSQPVPDIESVFTGRSSSERQNRQRRNAERRRENEQMSEEEWEENRRQRREARRQRQNSLPLPF